MGVCISADNKPRMGGLESGIVFDPFHSILEGSVHGDEMHKGMDILVFYFLVLLYLVDSFNSTSYWFYTFFSTFFQLHYLYTPFIILLLSSRICISLFLSRRSSGTLLLYSFVLFPPHSFLFKYFQRRGCQDFFCPLFCFLPRLRLLY